MSLCAIGGSDPPLRGGEKALARESEGNTCLHIELVYNAIQRFKSSLGLACVLGSCPHHILLALFCVHPLPTDFVRGASAQVGVRPFAST